MDRTRSPDGRFELFRTRRRDPEEAEARQTLTDWYLASLETGDELEHYSGSYVEREAEATYDGVCAVSFEGAATLRVGYWGGVPSEHVELPARVVLVDGGQTLELHFADGRSERRPREAVYAHVGGEYVAVTELRR